MALAVACAALCMPNDGACRSRSETVLAGGLSTSVSVAGSRPGVRAAFQQVLFARELACGRRVRLALGISGGPVTVWGGSTRAAGVAIRPLLVRWHITGGKVRPYVEVAGGALASDRPVPSETSRFNYTAHIEAGVRLAAHEGRAIVVGYRFEHLSNGGRLRRNPGVNSHALVGGLSWVR